MSQNMMIFVMAASISACFLTIVAMVLSGLALGQVYGLKNSTHKIIQGPWNQMPEPEPYINQEEENQQELNFDDIQDLPHKTKPLTIQEQMKKYMYRDIEDEQI